MPDNKKVNKSSQSTGKRRKSKRKANSPLSDAESTGFFSGGIVSVNSENGKGVSNSRKKINVSNCIEIRGSNSRQEQNTQRNMASFPQSQPQPSTFTFGSPSQFNQNSPQSLYGSNMMQNLSTPMQSNFQFQPVSSTPPLWATELLEDVRQIKDRLKTVDRIDKTVNLINVKVTDLETSLKSLEVRVNETELSCKFMSDASEKTNEELKVAKDELKSLKQQTKNLEIEKQNLEEKITKLETRSMGDNLMFYGMKEERDEDCKKLVKEVFQNQLGMSDEEAGEIRVIRAHRVGPRRPRMTKPRPVVAKFFDPDQRERIRQLSFDHADDLKAADIGMGIQWPKIIRDKRRDLIATMNRLKKDPLYKNKEIKLVVDKLLVDGRVYRPGGAQFNPDEETDSME